MIDRFTYATLEYFEQNKVAEDSTNNLKQLVALPAIEALLTNERSSNLNELSSSMRTTDSLVRSLTTERISSLVLSTKCVVFHARIVRLAVHACWCAGPSYGFLRVSLACTDDETRLPIGPVKSSVGYAEAYLAAH